jgi:hypothetical protein
MYPALLATLEGTHWLPASLYLTDESSTGEGLLTLPEPVQAGVVSAGVAATGVEVDVGRDTDGWLNLHELDLQDPGLVALPELPTKHGGHRIYPRKVRRVSF